MQHPRPLPASLRLPFSPSLLLFALFALGPFLTAPLPAQSATGAIEGRIVHGTTGRYLVNVRLTVDGTTLETFSDELGTYRLAGVPAGQVTLKAFFTGLTPAFTTLVVPAGQTATRDTSSPPPPPHPPPPPP